MEMEITNSGDRNDSHVHVERASKGERVEYLRRFPVFGWNSPNTNENL